MREQSSLADLLAVLFAMLFPSVAAWAYFVQFSDREILPLLYSASKIVQFAFPVAWIFLLRRGRSGHGQPSPAGPLQSEGERAKTRRNLAAGLVSGLAMSAVLGIAYLGLFRGSDLILAAKPRILMKIDAIGAQTLMRYLVLTVFLSVLHAFLEEYYWRWFVYAQLRRKLGFYPSAIVSSLSFMAHHVIIVDVMAGPGRFLSAVLPLSLSVALGGFVWAWLYERNATLTAPWISHMFVDLSVMAIGYDIAWGF